MIFCYKFTTFAEFRNFYLAKYRGRLIHGYSKTCIFLAKKQGVDLYTDSTYTPENTVCIHSLKVRRFMSTYRYEGLQVGWWWGLQLHLKVSGSRIFHSGSRIFNFPPGSALRKCFIDQTECES